MKRLKRRARAAIALAIAVVRLAHRALWLSPGQRLFGGLFYCALLAIGIAALEDLIHIITGDYVQ